LLFRELNFYFLFHIFMEETGNVLPNGAVNIDWLILSNGGNVPDLFAALSKFQWKLASTPITKNKEVKVSTRTGGSYTFRYADLDALHSAADPILAEFELSVAQPVLPDGSLMTILWHKSGQYIMSQFQIKPKFESGPQEIGSALTYTRRYAYTSLLGIVSEDDDDGNRASGNEYELGNANGKGDVMLDVQSFVKWLTEAKNLEELKAVWDDIMTYKWNAKETKLLDSTKDAMKQKLTPTDEKKSSIADKLNGKKKEPEIAKEAPRPEETMLEEPVSTDILSNDQK